MFHYRYIGAPDRSWATFQKALRIGELAEISLGRETVSRLVKDDPGVIKIRMGFKKTLQPTAFLSPLHAEFILICSA
jgi:hypothetical protein